MLAKLFDRFYPSLPVAVEEPIDRTRVAIVGVPGDIRATWFQSFLTSQKGVTCEGIVASSPHLAPTKHFPFISTTGLYDGEYFDSPLSWLKAQPGNEHATLSPEAFALYSAIERFLYEPFYRWLFTKRTDVAVQIYGRSQDSFEWLKRLHLRYVDYPQHFRIKKINLVTS